MSDIGDRRMVGPDDLGGPFQPQVSMILCVAVTLCGAVQ